MPGLGQSQQRHSLQPPLLAPGPAPRAGPAESSTPACNAGQGHRARRSPLPSASALSSSGLLGALLPESLPWQPADRTTTLCAQIPTGCPGHGTASKHFRPALKTLHSWPELLPLPAQTPRSVALDLSLFPGLATALRSAEVAPFPRSSLCSLQPFTLHVRECAGGSKPRFGAQMALSLFPGLPQPGVRPLGVSVHLSEPPCAKL